jgi:hypothetical protein
MEPVRALFASSLTTRDDDDNDDNKVINRLGGFRNFWYRTQVKRLLTILERWQVVQAVVEYCRSICYFPIHWNQRDDEDDMMRDAKC